MFIMLSGVVYNRSKSGTAFYEFSKRPFAVLISIGLILTIIVVFVSFPTQVPYHIGTIGVFGLFVSCLMLLLTQLSIWSLQSGIPIIPILIFFATAFSIFDLNDNHDLRRIDRTGASVVLDRASAPREAHLPNLDEQFLLWYNKRSDAGDPRYADGKYPVYIVSAQGGGIYAAAQALLFLVKMQARCELFAQHLFAISGVSGGSIGAAFFSALAREYENKNVKCRTLEEDEAQRSGDKAAAAYLAAGDLLERDYLSPLVAAALFPDFSQRFWPRPIPSWSRARALEHAMEAAWDAVVPQRLPATNPESNPLRRGIANSWDPLGARPALFLNTTEVETGRRRLIAPFSFRNTEKNGLISLPITLDYDVPLSAAAVASARFPWLTPSAWFWGAHRDPKNPTTSKYRAVDGGYFENSGVATAIDLIQELESVARRYSLPVQFHLVVVTSGGLSETSIYSLGEVLNPIRALLNARRAQTYATIDLANRQLGLTDTSATVIGTAASRIRRLQKVEVSEFLTPLPLGWRLSIASIYQIDRRTGLSRHCIPNGRFEQISPIPAFSSADCVTLLIYHQLRGDNLDDALEATWRRLLTPPKKAKQ